MLAAGRNFVAPRSIPASAGIGLRSPHIPHILALRPEIPWLEVHSENYFCTRGPAHEALSAIRADYPVSMHGVGLSLGSADELAHKHLLKLHAAVLRYEPCLVSEHLSWGAVAGAHVNDLLPLPLTKEALELLVDRVDAVQTFLGRQILIENVSTYFEFADSEMAEHAFIAELVRRSGCGLLLDVNNLYVNERNHGRSALEFICAIPRTSVLEIHLAGHSIQNYDGHSVVVDTHDEQVCPAVWNLYAAAISRFGSTPTLIEWDSKLPALDVLIAEALAADRIMEKTDAVAA